MKFFITIVIAITAAALAGFFVGQSWESAPPASSATGERDILYYKAPMDPNYRRDAPGKSPMGMDLVPVYADEASVKDDDVVQISPAVVNNLGIRTARVEQGPLSREIQTVGYIGYNEDTLHTIATRVDGWIERLAVTATGNPVSKGQTLLELYSPTLVNAQREYLAALQSSNPALHSASRERLAALGISKREIDRLQRERTIAQRVRIQAPAGGVVAHLAVREGQYVTAASDIMSIGSLDNVWLHAEVLERQAARVAAGQTVRIELEALPGQTLTGEVDYVYPELDPVTRTLTARIRLDNASGALRPNMFARATIMAGERSSALHIPLAALIRGGSVDRVVIVNDDGGFRSQPVTPGIESGDRVEVISGLARGDEVVTSGQFLIDSESNIDSALARMDMSSDKTSDATASHSANVTATVVKIDSGNRRVTLSHSAIAHWSMPAMTMSFDVASSVDLMAVEQGATGEVRLERHGASHIMVVHMDVTASGDDDHRSGDAMPMEHDHSGHGMTPADDSSQSADPHAGHNMSPDVQDEMTDMHEMHEMHEEHDQ